MKVQRIAQLLGHKASIYALAQGPEPHILYSAAGDGWVVEWDLREPENGQLKAQVAGNIFALHYFPERHWMAIGNMQGGVHWVDMHKGESFRNSQTHQQGVFGFLELGEELLSIGGDGTLTRWNIEKAKPLETLQLSRQRLRSIVYDETRQELLIGASDNNIYILDAQTWLLQQKIEQAHDNSVFCLAQHPRKPWLLSGGRDAHLRLWDREEAYAPLQAIPAHLFTINQLAFSPDGRFLATASRDKSFKIWDADSLDLLKVIDGPQREGHLNSVNCLLWSTFEDYLLTGSDDRSIRLWKLA